MTDRSPQKGQKALKILANLGESLENLKSGLKRQRAKEKASRVGEAPTQNVQALEGSVQIGPLGSENRPEGISALSDTLPPPSEVKDPLSPTLSSSAVVEDVQKGSPLELPAVLHDVQGELEVLDPVPDFTSVEVLEEKAVQAQGKTETEEPAWLADVEGFESELPPPVGEGMEAVEEDLPEQLDPEFAEVVQGEADERMPLVTQHLEALGRGEKGAAEKLHREVHSMKGLAGVVGAKKTQLLIHQMETIMEEINWGRSIDQALLNRLQEIWARVQERWHRLYNPDMDPSEADSAAGTAVVMPKSVRITAENIDRLYNETNEARLAASSLYGNTKTMRHKLREMEDNIGRVSRMSRDLEIQAEMQIQSRQAQLAESNEEFDPLEMDRFTLLQELNRLLAEAVSDVQDLQRDLTRMVAEQETNLAYQERSILEVHEGLHKVRLVPVDGTLNDRLHKVALSAAKELGKSVSFLLSGGRVALDRSMLDRIASPLEHLVRNAVAHGIEAPEERKNRGKPAAGQIRIGVRQEAGRVMFVVEDDGAGLNVEKIRQKAIEKGMWPSDQAMDEKQAVDMICRPNFSTADALSQVAGRGVGMDAVRSDVLAMGGRFELASRSGRGLRASIQVPTVVAASSVMVVDAGGETWSVPIEIVDDLTVLRGSSLEEARHTQSLSFGGQLIPFARLDALMGVNDSSVISTDSAPVLLLKEGERRVAVEVSKLREVAEVPLRPLGKLWSKTPGVVGSTLLPDGRASFLVDPLRAPWELLSPESSASTVGEVLHRAPTILVVDDSITVRKVTAQFLERHGFEPVLAKDGQEALELLAQIKPAAMLLDVEMPRMDGFDCAKNVRESPRHRDLPIIMITSRTADKHRDRAMALGVNEYMGKPFREEELLAHLNRYVPR